MIKNIPPVQYRCGLPSLVSIDELIDHKSTTINPLLLREGIKLGETMVFVDTSNYMNYCSEECAVKDKANLETLKEAENQNDFLDKSGYVCFTCGKDLTDEVNKIRAK